MKYPILNKMKFGKKEMILGFVSLCLSLIAAEVVLRIAGYKPGRFSQPQGFSEVDSLILYNTFIADSFSVTHLDTSPRNRIQAFIANKQNIDSELFYRVFGMSEYNEMATDFSSALYGRDSGIFTRYIQSVLHKPASQLSDFDSAVIAYVRCPLNEYGFRSMPFRKNSSKKRVLLLGDSFTYGYNAKNKTNSFPDILIAAGYEVYNTGIGGSGSADYLSIARVYIPMLQPDYVITNFCLGNDADVEMQTYKPFQPHHYLTNAGMLESCPDGVSYDTPEEVYELIRSRHYINPNNLFASICAGTCITTLLWSVLNCTNTEAPVYSDFKKRSKEFLLDQPYANIVMKQIEELCSENGSTFIVSIIPNCLPLSDNSTQEQTDKNFRLQYVKDIEKLFPPPRFTTSLSI